MTKSFVSISNREIFDKLNTLESKNAVEHQEIKAMISGYKSQIARLYWALGGLGTMLIALFTMFFRHIEVN